MTSTPETIRVVISLSIRKRNGLPKFLPPEGHCVREGRTQDPHVLRAIARAWKWRRQLESGAVATIQDIAAAETVSDRFIGRTIRLAYLAPSVLEALVIARRPPAISIKDLMIVAELPWGEQMRRVFEQAEHRE